MALPRNLYELLRESARERAKSPFIHYPEGPGVASLSYGEALRRTDALAAALAKRGVKRGETFAIILRNSPDFVLTYLALSRLGAVAVPLNFMITKGPELDYLLRDSGAVGLVTQEEFLKNFEPLRAGLPRLKVWLGTDVRPEGGGLVSELIEEGSGAPEAGPSAAEPGDTACVLYTSGTTGQPKGARLSHANILSNCAAFLPVAPEHRDPMALDILPLFHTFGWQSGVVGPLMKGASVLMMSSITPPRAWLSLMGKLGVTMFFAVPQVYSVISREATGLKRLYLRWFAFRRVQMGVSAAAPLTASVIDAFEDKLGVPIYEAYGLTETSPVISINIPGSRKRGTVGKPIPGVEVVILDDSEAELPLGQAGEICARGPNVMQGYLNKPEATREAFTKDGRWFKTGDIGFLDADGYLSICDRKKDMIIVKGLKVFSAQVEAVLAEHPAVAEAAVVGLPDAETGDETIRAFVTLKPGAAADKAELAAFMKERLDPYKRPRSVEILDALPKNALQKILKYELRKRAARPA